MRLPKLEHSQLTPPRQREAYDKHAAKRDRVSGPYNVWLHDPASLYNVYPGDALRPAPGTVIDLHGGHHDQNAPSVAGNRPA